MTIAHHTAIDMLREKKRELPKEEVEIKDSESISMEEMTDKEAGEEEFLRLLGTLKEVDRQIISLHLIGELKHKEIAGVLDMSVDAVKKRYERAIKKLAEELKDEK